MSRLYRLEQKELAAAEAVGPGRVPPTPRDAAGVVLVRDGDTGLEVLLVRRRADVGFAANAYVFPGGTLDAEDGDPAWRSLLEGIDPRALAGAVDAAADDGAALAFAVAALREMFEETGVLLAAGALPDREALAAERAALVAGRRRFLDIVRERGIRLAVSRLVLCARWVTPESLSRRYDARFFLAAAPSGVEVEAEQGELVEHRWIAPGTALERYFELDLRMMYPTARTLEWLTEGGSVEDLRQRFLAKPIVPILPRLRHSADGVIPVIPGEPRYDERDGDG